jgi:DNA-binding NtrC family response regulator
MSAPALLIADDQPDVVEALRLLFKRDGYAVVSTNSPAGVIGALEGQEFDAALIDLNYARDTTSGREGLDLLGRIRAHWPNLPVVVMTAWGSVESAVEAMRLGARDYVQKPWDNTRLLTTLRVQVQLGRALHDAHKLSEGTSRLQRAALPSLVAQSDAMKAVLEIVERIGPSEANVLITGEHGTGKEVIARQLHDVSPRASRPLVPVNAGALPEGVFESELFGHVKGAFTDAKSDRTGCFELASESTLFLDEVGNMPLSQQAKLLRVLQTGEFHPVGSSRVRKTNARVISATNVDLRVAVQKGTFREDLLYRLNTVELVLPALRERRDDIVPLASAFLERQARKYRRDGIRFSNEALRALLEYSWPGNVRELEHAVERATLLARGDEVTTGDLALRTASEPASHVEQMTLEEAERYLIQRALGKCDGNVSEAAKLLGVSRSALYRRLEAYGLKES